MSVILNTVAGDVEKLSMDENTPQPKVRAWINRHSAAVTAASLACIVGAMVAIVRQTKPPPTEPVRTLGYFYDLATDEIFVERTSLIPPINVPGANPETQPSGVRAFIFACSDCADPNDRFLAWVETYTPEGKLRQEQNQARDSTDNFPPIGPRHGDRGHLVAKPDPDNPNWKTNWIPYYSDEGSQIISRPQDHCTEQLIATICNPPERNGRR